MDQKHRCAWAQKSPLEAEYHDTEWGVPLHDDHRFFEFIVMDSFQAGLSWVTVLRKREGFRKAFANFEAERVAAMGEADVERLMQDTDIVRNRLKIRATITNAQAFLRVQEEFGSFDAYVWRFTGGKTITNSWTERAQVPATSPESDALSADLKKRGFKFVGSTICYAFMQAAGMINDHEVSCFRYEPIRDLATN